MSAEVVSQLTDDLSTLKVSPQESKTKVKAVQPDISYHPNLESWKARTARRLAENPDLPKTPLPAGFPKKLDSPLVWDATVYTDPSQWEYELSPEHLKEIDDALKFFQESKKPLGLLSPETFPLPTLSPILKELANELHNGRGFFVLRTIPVEKYSEIENNIIYAGVSSYIGRLRAVQDVPNTVLAHIADLTATVPLKAIGAPAYTADKQVYHTDIGDIIALYVLQNAAEGGISRISSSWKVYNEIAETRPDLIKTLSEPWPTDGFGRDPPYTLRSPLFHLPATKTAPERVIIQYARRLFTGFLGLPRSENIPPITEAHAEALDTLHFLAEKHSLGLSFKQGDIQYINNLSIFHGRDAFTDSSEKRRHLLRLWLRNEELAWKTPDGLKDIWKKLYYTLPVEEQRFPTVVEIRDGSKGSGATY